MKTTTNLTKEKRKTIANAQKMVDLMNSVKSKINKSKTDSVKADLVKIAEKTGEEMRARYDRNLKEGE